MCCTSIALLLHSSSYPSVFSLSIITLSLASSLLLLSRLCSSFSSTLPSPSLFPALLFYCHPLSYPLFRFFFYSNPVPHSFHSLTLPPSLPLSPSFTHIHTHIHTYTHTLRRPTQYSRGAEGRPLPHVFASWNRDLGERK